MPTSHATARPLSRNRRATKPQPVVSASEPITTVSWWLRDSRQHALQQLLARTARLRWSHRLLRVLVDEFGVDEELVRLLGPLSALPVRRYPQVIAIAIALRHSWREDSLIRVAKRIERTNRPLNPSPARRRRVRRR